jgi:hypothetical protein
MLFVAGVCFSEAEDYSHIDYMKLNRKSMPHVQLLIQKALDHLEVNEIDGSEEWRQRFRRNGLYPKLQVFAAYAEEGVPHKDWVEYVSQDRYDGSASYDSPPGGVDVKRRTTATYEATGHDPVLDWGVKLTWDLTQLVFNYDEHQVLYRKSTQASLVRRRTVDVSKRYALLMGALPEDEFEEADPGMMAVIFENASILDEWTDGLLTKVLENIERRHLADGK